MAKEIKFNIKAREELKNGVDALADAVKVPDRCNTRSERTQRNHREEVRRSTYYKGRCDCSA